MAKKQYTLVGVDGNAYSIMGYTARALRETGQSNLVDEMYEEATKGDYCHLIAVCDNYVNKANEKVKETK